jgi:D-lactate dehydrogenase (quinone)
MNTLSASKEILQKLIHVVGKQHVLTEDSDTRLYRQGRRYGSGDVFAVVAPGSLIEQWKVLQLAVEADFIVIMQAANTGLTGGSTPFGEYDRPVIVLSTRRLKGIQVIQDGKQVVCLPGATLDALEKELSGYNREPHSVIGSSCIGASVLGGVCNNSGGALVRRGPAYTELALYARVNEEGSLELINHLGIDLGQTPEEILLNLEHKKYDAVDVQQEEHRCASDQRYSHDVCQVDENTPARFNADPTRLFEASGSAGKVCVFAVRLDTFEKIPSQVFYVGTNSHDDLTEIRRFLLKDLPRVPIAGEYIHRVAYDIGAEFGKDTFMFIEKFGTAKVPAAFAMKDKVDGYLQKFGLRGLSDKVLQWVTKFLPSHLPKRMNEFRDLYEHHLVLRIEHQDAEQVTNFFTDYFKQHTTGDFFCCTDEEGRKAFLHRFAVAGAAIRYRDTHLSEVEDIVALDIALRRNDREWVETLPKEMDEKILHKLYYGHFLCHVFHQDYIVKKGVDPLAMEHEMWKLLDGRGAEYPAEHNVGHLYVAKPALKNHYQKLDPTNSFNVGIGYTSKLKNWK